MGIATLQRLNLPQQWPFCRAESDVLMARRPASGALERNHLLPGGCTDAVFEVPGTWFEQGSPLERRVWWECKVLDAQADGVKARDARASWQKNLRSSLGNSLVPASAPRFRAGRSHDAHVGHVMRNRTAA